MQRGLGACCGGPNLHDGVVLRLATWRGSIRIRELKREQLRKYDNNTLLIDLMYRYGLLLCITLEVMSFKIKSQVRLLHRVPCFRYRDWLFLCFSPPSHGRNPSLHARSHNTTNHDFKGRIGIQ